jgi:hypothetical protein
MTEQCSLPACAHALGHQSCTALHVAAAYSVVLTTAAAVLRLLQVLEDSKITMSMIQASRYVAGIK